MLSNFFVQKTLENFSHIPTEQQQHVLEKLGEFLCSHNNDSLFVLEGYAGTGKSSLVGAVVKTMVQLQQKTVLLAPSGRAAKVLASYADQPAYTIHKKIYRQKIFSNEPTGFVLADNLHKHTLFIVDEASMIPNDGLDSFSFGSGRLLDDLFRYVYSGEGCRLFLIGDSAQLPPVSQSDSPGLNPNILKGFVSEVYKGMLTQVVRQEEMSGILLNATHLRESLTTGNTNSYPKLITGRLPDVTVVKGDELLDTLNEAYDRDGIEETLVISRSNKRAGIFNSGIRNRILYREEEITSGDLLIVAKNNYYWGKELKEIDFIANGDLMEVLRIRRIRELYGFRFCDLSVRFPDYELETELMILLDTLSDESPGLSKELNDKLFYSILEDYADIPGKREKMKKMKDDPFYNVVQVKYAYALTCHKAQGGQWKNIFVDLSYVPESYLGIDFYRWLYTAFTRATQHLYLVNPTKELL